MKLLILTQYFPPEVGAPQNRLFELAVRLNSFGVKVTVLTAMPNYPQMEVYPAYKNKKVCVEEISELTVYRSSIFVSKNKSILTRMRNYFSFVISSAVLGREIPGDFDFLLCESPPLFLGYSAMYLAKKKQANLIFNVSDLWPESAEKLGVVTNKLLLKLAYKLEARLYKRSILVTGQTQGICKNIAERFPQVKTFWLPNGVDPEYYNPEKSRATNWRLVNGFSASDIVILYAGIIGIAQGLEIILQSASILKIQKNIKFVLLGSGPEKSKLETLKNDLKLENVYFLDPVSKTDMPSVLKTVDAAIIPLRKLELFQGAIPSKIFESLSMELPIILGVDGEAKDLFIHQGNCGIYFEPENVDALCAAVQQLSSDEILRKQLGKNGREFVTKNFNRNVIAKNFHERLKSLMP